MKLYYRKLPAGNFGDDLNPWLWTKLIPELLDDDDETLFVGIGTLLNSSLPKEPRKRIFGTGVGYGEALGFGDVDEKWKVYCVRGPLSAEALGLSKQLAITDPAVLVRNTERIGRHKRTPVSFMPHWQSAKWGDWPQVCQELSVKYIDPSDDVQRILNTIAESELLLTEAMHGAIVADALRVPWIPLIGYPENILRFKWLDWCKSLQLDYKPHTLPCLWKIRTQAGVLGRLRHGIKKSLVVRQLNGVMRKVQPSLSSEWLLRDMTERLTDLLEIMRDDVHVAGS